MIIYSTVPQCIPEDDDERQIPSNRPHYYLLPCFSLFDQCRELTSNVLKTMGSAITESSLYPISDDGTQHTRNYLSGVNSVASVLVLMHKDAKMQRIMSAFKEDINNIIHKVYSLQVTLTSMSNYPLKLFVLKYYLYARLPLHWRKCERHYYLFCCSVNVFSFPKNYYSPFLLLFFALFAVIRAD